MPSIDELIARLELPSSTAATFINDERKEAAQALQSRQREVERLTTWREGGVIFDALCTVRCHNAGDFSGKMNASQGEAYDRAVLDCFAEVVRALTQSKDTVK